MELFQNNKKCCPETLFLLFFLNFQNLRFYLKWVHLVEVCIKLNMTVQYIPCFSL